MGWLGKKKPQAATPGPSAAPMGAFSTHLNLGAKMDEEQVRLHDSIHAAIQAIPHPSNGAAMDSSMGEVYPIKTPLTGVPPIVGGWYVNQTFIGYQMCALMGQHWLIDKACSMPAKDAVRQGYEVDVEAPDAEGGDDKAATQVAHDAAEMIKEMDTEMRLKKTMQEFIHFGRMYGIRVAMFKVESTDPEYYTKPFNIDGVAPGSYRGISQVDPQWCVPDLTDANLGDPSSILFYEPSYYRIGNLLVHRSHLCIYIPFPVSDFLKPGYQYGGVSVPQRIYERVYAAERTANEAPILAMTKRMLTVNLPDSAFADEETLNATIAHWAVIRDNHGIRVGGLDERVTQLDTSLTDLDSVIMTQYQLVAAIAEVPSTKLLGTSPKGFGASGEYEEASYREFLEGIQGELDFMVSRHHELCMKSKVAPALGIEPLRVTAQWQSLDSPTALEWADIELKRAQTDEIYVRIQSVDGMDVRRKLKSDKESSYFNLADVEEGEIEPPLDPITGEPLEPEENPLIA